MLLICKQFAFFLSFFFIWIFNQSFQINSGMFWKYQSVKKNFVCGSDSDSWRPVSTVNAPFQEIGLNVSVWTGNKMIVWGMKSKNGGIYDPIADEWKTMSNFNSPHATQDATAIWTGTEMIVWGGQHFNFPLPGGDGYQNTGSIYNLQSNTWRKITTVSAPKARWGHKAFWIENRMVIMAGEIKHGDGRGGLYDPVTDSWKLGSETYYEDWVEPAGVYTGNKVLLWGGGCSSSANCPNDEFNRKIPPTIGAAYNDLSEVPWQYSLIPPPPNNSGYGSIGVWNPGSNEMIIWRDDLFRYNPTAGNWTQVSSPSVFFTFRYKPSMISSGDQIILWGGYKFEPGVEIRAVKNSGAIYDPKNDTWMPTDTIDSDTPAARAFHIAHWIGDGMIIWGGAFRKQHKYHL